MQHGYLHTNDGQYMIEPLKRVDDVTAAAGDDDSDPATSQPHPHLVYNRLALPAEHDILRADAHADGSSEASCGVKGSYYSLVTVYVC